jgi:hypothetical protein
VPPVKGVCDHCSPETKGRCWACDGTGKTWSSKICTTCNGTGICRRCRGRGRIDLTTMVVDFVSDVSRFFRSK